MLIENRCGKRLLDTYKICPYHRYTMGISWKKLKRCCCPNQAFHPGKKAPQTCPTSVGMTNRMSKKYNAVISVGSGLCTNHLNKERLYMQKGVKETIEEDSTNSSKQCDDLDPDYEPQGVSILLRDDECLDTSKALSDILDCSPIPFQVMKKYVSTLSDHTKKCLIQKHEQMQKQLTQKFAELTCPGQKDILQPTSSLSDSHRYR